MGACGHGTTGATRIVYLRREEAELSSRFKVAGLFHGKEALRDGGSHAGSWGHHVVRSQTPSRQGMKGAGQARGEQMGGATGWWEGLDEMKLKQLSISDFNASQK